jgi:hypothetical protein
VVRRGRRTEDILEFERCTWYVVPETVCLQVRQPTDSRTADVW